MLTSENLGQCKMSSKVFPAWETSAKTPAFLKQDERGQRNHERLAKMVDHEPIDGSLPFHLGGENLLQFFEPAASRK